MQTRRLAAACLCVTLSAATLLGQTPPQAVPSSPPASAVTSSDGRRSAWVSNDGRSVWSASRTSPAAGWDAPVRLLTIRGAVRNLVFSPDGKRLAFENPRGAATTATRNDGWGFIAVFDLAARRISYVDPSFGIDTDPAWSRDGGQIAFLRTIGALPGVRLTKPVPQLRTWSPPQARPSESFSLASVLAAPFVYTPSASGDGRAIAYASREGVSRNIYYLRLGEAARQIVSFPGDDGQELTDLAVSQRGGAVAFVRGATSNPTSLPDPPQAEIWIVGSKSDSARRLGPGTSPRFSSDDKRLLWSSGGRAMSATLTWQNGRLTGAGTPEPVAVTPPPAPELRGLASPDGTRIANRRATGIEVYDVASKTTWAVPNSTGSDSAMVWSPDSRLLAFRKSGTGVQGSAGIGGYRYNGAPVAAEPWSLWVADPSASDARQLFQATAGMGSVGTGPLFWSDDHRVAFEWEGDGWKHYYSVPAAGGPVTLVTRGDGDVEVIEVSRDHKHLIVTSNIGDLGRRHISIVDFKGGTIAIVKQGAASQWAPVQLADGRLAYIEAGHAMPPAVMIRERDGTTSPVGLPRVPASFPAAKLVEPLLVEFPATDGKVAYGQLFVPVQPKGCGIIFVHGGIRRQMLPGFHYMDAYTNLYEMNQYLASHGCVVLSVEYRSSIMRGYAFRHAPGWGHAGASEMLDVVGGAKYLMARADVDASRGIGIYGLSWGGYITAQALARHSDIFSVGFDMAGVHTSTDAAGVQHSAMAYLDSWTSPVLLSQGDDDRNVVFTEGVKLARALLEKRPGVEFVQRVVPNETHDMYLTFENLVTVYQEGADFLLKKLLGPAHTTRGPGLQARPAHQK
jgi:dipeptidyl aminopeptidase/acylaminoacyl peptidase